MNRIVTIGYMSRKICYLNMAKEEALIEHRSSEPDMFDELGNLLSIYDVDEFEFDQSFAVHDIWEYE